MSNLVKAVLIINAKKAGKKGWSDKARKSAAAKRKRKTSKKVEVKETTVPVAPLPPVDKRPFLMGHAEMEALKQKMKQQRRDNPFPFFS